MPAVSLIVPVYNVAQYLERCVNSIADQIFTDFEAIFVNDGSTDNSQELCKQLIAPYSNMRMVSKKNGGLTSARLKGLSVSKGKYIAFIDSDDYLEPNYIEELYRLIVKYDADLSMCSYNVVNNGNKIVQNIFTSKQNLVLDGESIRDGYFLPQITSIYKNSKFLPSFMWLRLIKRSILSEEFFVSERICYQEDLVFSARIFKKLKRVVISDTPLYDYCINQGSLTLKYRESAWEMMQNLTSEIKSSLNQTPDSRQYILAQVLHSVHFCMLNAARRDWQTFKSLWNVITENDVVKDNLRNVSINGLKNAYLPLMLSYWIHLPCLLYYFNKRKV